MNFPPVERQKKTPERRKIAKSAMPIFLPMFVLALIVTAAILFPGSKAEIMDHRNTEMHTVAIQAANIGQDIL